MTMNNSPVRPDHRLRISPKSELFKLIFMCLSFVVLPVFAGEQPPDQAYWAAEDVSAECDVTPLVFEFGPIPIMQTETRYLRVINHGDEPLTLDPTSDSLIITVEAGPIVIPPGEAAYPWVTFHSAIGDTIFAEISLGPEICSSVSCIGILSFDSGDQENVIGITFDPESLVSGYFESSIIARPGTLVTGYLALLNPSVSEPLAGWECCASMQGDGHFLSWRMDGYTTNLLHEPCFMLGQGEPIQPAPYYILSVVTILVNSLQEDIFVHLRPIFYSSIPDEMAWFTAGEDSQLIPMKTAYGYPEVAHIQIDSAAGIPGSFPEVSTRLLSNAPNPFNPQTEIRFELGRAGAASVKVFDVTGRLVNTLVNQSLGPGAHSCIWYGKDDRGRRVPSGTYYIRLEAGGRVDHSKVMMLK